MTDAMMADLMAHPWWLRAGYLIGLGLLSEGAALLTLGLVRPWGEVVPLWLPVVGGRAVPRLLAVVLAVGGAVMVGSFCWSVVLGGRRTSCWPSRQGGRPS